MQLASRCAGLARPLEATLLSLPGQPEELRIWPAGLSQGWKILSGASCHSISTFCKLKALVLFHRGSSETSPTAAAPPRPITMETACIQFPFPLLPCQ